MLANVRREGRDGEIERQPSMFIFNEEKVQLGRNQVFSRPPSFIFKFSSKILNRELTHV